jgi:hypothetical protein
VQAAPAHTRAAGSARLRLSVARRAVAVTGDGVVDFARGRGSLVLDLRVLGLGSLEQRVVGRHVYLRLPDQVGSTPSWLAVGLGNAAGADLLTSVDPAAALDYLAGATGAVRRGADDVGGVRATHYVATIRALAPALTVDVWLDGAGRVVRESYGAAGFRTTLDLDRFGLTVTVAPPPSDQVSRG